MDAALWRDRSLVKTHLMRQTLHLVPADDFSLYISALKNCRVADALRIMRRFGIGEEEGHSLTPLIIDALSKGPLRRTAITAAIRPKVSKRVRAWMAKVWSIVRVPMAEGMVCYGPGEGNEVTLIRTDHWLKSQPPWDEGKARAELLRRYLSAYGPATIRDFAHWSGMPAGEVRPLPALLAAELEEIPAGTTVGLMLRKDVQALAACREGESSVRLLPHFDPYLLAHREKDHLVAPHLYKRVYRNQGWISPVVLVHGAVAGVWSHKIQARKLIVTVNALTKMAKPLANAIEQEAESLASFLGSTLGDCTISKN